MSISGKRPTGQRIIEMDMARGIGIILVTLGHSEPIKEVFPLLWETIYLFHMPLFFFLSGFFSAKASVVHSVREYGEFLYRRLKFLIIPYITVSLVFTIIKALVPHLVKRRIEWDRVVIDILLTPGSNPAATLWFVYTIIALIAIAPLMKIVKWPIMLPGLLFLNALDIQTQFLGLICISRYALYFYLGMLSYPESDSFFSVLKKPLLLIVSIVLFATFSHVYSYPPNVFMRLFLACCGTYFVLGICFVFKDFLPSSGLQFLGYRSFDIYILQYFFIFPGLYAFRSLSLAPEFIVIVNFFLGIIGPLLVSVFIFSKSRALSITFGASNVRSSKKI